MYLRPCIYVLINVLKSCDLSERIITHSLIIRQPPAFSNPHRFRTKIHPTADKYTHTIDNNSQASYNIVSKPTERTYVSCLSPGTEAAL